MHAIAHPLANSAFLFAGFIALLAIAQTIGERRRG
jgi:hypothetical protein